MKISAVEDAKLENVSMEETSFRENYSLSKNNNLHASYEGRRFITMFIQMLYGSLSLSQLIPIQTQFLYYPF
jgi:hypothetical protein